MKNDFETVAVDFSNNFLRGNLRCGYALFEVESRNLVVEFVFNVTGVHLKIFGEIWIHHDGAVER